MTIDDFARRMGTSARNVRAYQERGLLPPPVLEGRTGYYDDAHAERFRTVQRLQGAGFSLSAIRALLDTWEAGGSLGDVVGAGPQSTIVAHGVPDTSTLFPATKFQRPAERAEHIPRTRCLKSLSGGRDSHVLITSPGGSGKTTLAAQLVAQREDPVAWVSLEPSDNAAGSFWAAVLLALRAALPDFGGDLLIELIGGGDIDHVLVRTADRLSAPRQPLSVVLDDLHEISNPTVMRQLGWLLEHVQPRTCRIVMCSRTRPALPISELVVRARLVEVRTEDVSFDDDEVRQLLQERLGVTLNAAEVNEIATGTDGWAAGVYLTGLALQAGMPTGAVIDSLAVPDRRIQDYFADEILHAISAEHLEFLAEVAFLDRFTADLCDTVRTGTGSQAILDELRDNMFVIRLDDTGFWQRLHQVLAGVLRARAGAEDLPDRHRRAADWYLAADLVPEAIGHYVQAGAYREAAAVIGDVYPLFMNISHQGAIVDRWLTQLPQHLVAETAALNLAAACVAGLRGDRNGMARRLRTAEGLPGEPEQTRAIAEFIRGTLNFGEIEEALRCVQASYGHHPRNELWFPMQGAVLALLRTWVHGPDDEVLRIVDEVLADESAADQPIALAGLWALRGNVLARQGAPGALVAVTKAAEIRRDSHIDRVPQAVNTWSSTARTYRLLGDIDAAAADAETGYQMVADLASDRDATGAVVPILIELIYVRRFQGQLAEAREYAAEARHRLRTITGPGQLPAWLAEAADGL